MSENLYKRYGKDRQCESWALITGGDDGLGYKIGKQLAQ